MMVTKMRVVLVRKKMGHLSPPWTLWICPFWGRQESPWLADFLVHAHIEPPKLTINYTTTLNFEKFHKEECNLEFDETIVIRFKM